MLRFQPLTMQRSVVVDAGHRHTFEQQSMDRYLVDFASSLTGSESHKSRSLLITLTYDSLKASTRNVVGQSARTLAEQIDGKSWAQILPWVRKCILALEKRGLAYRTFDDQHFSATSSQLELDDPTIDQLVEEVFDCAVEQDEDMVEDHVPQAEAGSNSHRSMKRVPIFGGRTQRRAPTNFVDGFRSVEVTGRVNRTGGALLWFASMCQTKKARLFEHAVMGSARAPQVCSAEYSVSGEYVLSASSNGRLHVFKSCSAAHHLRDTWEEARGNPAAFPVRDVPGIRGVDVAHWNPGNRNEVGTCAKTSADIQLFDMKRCGTSSDRRQNVPSLVFSHKTGQGQGMIMDFSFVPQLHVVVAGTTGGSAMLWDARSARAPKMCLSQRDGGLSFTQMLSDGHTLVGGTAEGAVHVWDLRAARAGMNVMSLGGRNDQPLFSARIDPQLPVTNAEGVLCEGVLAVPPDASHRRSYALEPCREVELAFAVGRSCVGVLNLLSRRVSHVYIYSPADARDAVPHDKGRRKLAWLAPSPRRCTLVHADGSARVSLFDVDARRAQRERAWDEVSLMRRDTLTTPGEVASVAAHPTDPSVALGLEGALWAVSFGHGTSEEANAV